MRKKKERYIAFGSGKHNTLTKRLRQNLADKKLQQYKKPDLTLFQKTIANLLKILFKIYCLPARVKMIFKRDG